MEKRYVHVHLLGTSITIGSDEDPNYTEKIVTFLEKKIRETERIVGVKDPLKIAILTGILLADELHKERAKSPGETGMSPEESSEAERIARRMLNSIDTSLQEG